MSDIKLFISHSSKDAELADSLIQAIENTLNPPSGAIRCTSVPGYKLELGTFPTEKLREELKDIELVIGLITPNSINSDWVLFELGASWGLYRRLIPVLVGDIGSVSIPEPIKNINAVTLSDSNSISFLIEEIGNVLNWKISSLSKVQAAQEKLFTMITKFSKKNSILEYMESIKKYSNAFSKFDGEWKGNSYRVINIAQDKGYLKWELEYDLILEQDRNIVQGVMESSKSWKNQQYGVKLWKHKIKGYVFRDCFFYDCIVVEESTKLMSNGLLYINNSGDEISGNFIGFGNIEEPKQIYEAKTNDGEIIALPKDTWVGITRASKSKQ